MIRILHLTLHRKWFDAIANGTKAEEYRTATPYWTTRLEGKTFDVIHFRNGYSLDKPFMKVECKKIELRADQKTYAIHLGKILDIKNYPN